MSNIIKHIRIDKLFGTKNIDWELNPSVNVLVGQNGSGKSTILKAIELTLDKNTTTKLSLIDKCTITLSNNDTYVSNIKLFNPDLIRRALEFAMNTDFKKEIADPQKENFIKLLESSLDYTGNERGNSPHHEISFNKLIENKNISTEFISTINLNSNAVNGYTDSSGKYRVILNDEIKNEILRLLTSQDKTLQDKLLSALNSLFSETQKTIEFNKNQLVVKIADGKHIDFDKLSSGERQVIFIFLKVVNASVDGALILMDEPEISLHLSWQEKLLNEIRRVNDKSQIIIVTHSPAILMNGWMDSFVDIKNIMTDATIDDDNTLSDSTV